MGGYSIMARNVDQALREQWRQRIERQRGSGLSIAEFCRREGVSQASFHAWKRKLRSSAYTSPSARRSAVERPRVSGRQAAVPRPQRPQPSPAHSAAATPATSFLQLPVPMFSARTVPWIELVLVDGTIVRVPQQNLAALQTVLQVVRDGRVTTAVGEVSHA
jgi:hypothetical protein